MLLVSKTPHEVNPPSENSVIREIHQDQVQSFAVVAYFQRNANWLEVQPTLVAVRTNTSRPEPNQRDKHYKFVWVESEKNRVGWL